jgi:hypothetical protein
MKLHRELNEGTIYAESAWLNLIDEMTKSVETSNLKKGIMETNLVPLGLGSEDITGDIFALIRGPEQGLGRIFNDNIDKNTTSLIIKLVQNCHFMKIKMRNQATKQHENLDLLIGYDTPWDFVINAIESYMKTLAGFTESSIKTFGFIKGKKIVNFDLVRAEY